MSDMTPGDGGVGGEFADLPSVTARPPDPPAPGANGDDRGMRPVSAARTIMMTLAAMIALSMSPIVYATEVIVGPGTSDPLLKAALWMQDTLVGEIAANTAVVALAAIGFVMLTERLDWHFGLAMMVGCLGLLAIAALFFGADHG